MTARYCPCGHTPARHALHADDHPCQVRECRCDGWGNQPTPYPFRPDRADPGVAAMHAERRALVSQTPTFDPYANGGDAA